MADSHNDDASGSLRDHDSGEGSRFAGRRVDRFADSLFTGVDAMCTTAARLTGVDGAAVAVLTTSTQRELVYATDPLAQNIDELQFTLGEGPCLDAYLRDRPQLFPHLETSADAARWPAFALDAMDLGVQAVFAFPVPGQKRPLGVLELYRRTAGELDDAQHETASVCAAAVGQTLRANWDAVATRAGSVEVVLESAEFDGRGSFDPFTRSQVYVAAGMVAVQLAVGVDEAVDRLRAHAYATAQSVTTLSSDIIARRVSLRDHRHDATDG